MALAIGTIPGLKGTNIEAVDAKLQRTELSLSALSNDGLPARRARMDFAGEMGDWESADFSTYCAGLGIELPAWANARHQVFSKKVGNSTTVYVPALALMRAFFWPCREVLPATFTSQNVDRLAYVSYGGEFPVVTVMKGPDFFQSFDAREGNDRHLKWLHGSLSARSCCQSVELYAIKGLLGLKLPQGEFDLSLVGHLAGSSFFATAVEVNSVKVSADDNVSGQEEMFYLHRSPLTDAMRRAEKVDPAVTEDEWRALEPFLAERKFTEGPEMLGLMLRRLANGYWDLAAPGVVSEAGRVLRAWTTGAMLGDILERLLAIRRGCFPTNTARLEQLGAGVGAKVDRPGPDDRVIKVFLDTEFVDKEGEVLLLSIGVAADDGEFYGERAPSSLGDKFSAGKFIDSEVLPQLGLGVGLQGTMCDIAKGLVAWLNGQGADRVEVHYDFNLDYTLLEHLVALVPGQLAPVLAPVHVGYLLDEEEGVAAAVLSWVGSKASRGIQRHHALADAIALKARFHAVHEPLAGRE